MPAAAARPCVAPAPALAPCVSTGPCYHRRLAQQPQRLQQRDVAAFSGRKRAKGKGDPTRPIATHERKPRPPKERLAPKGMGFYETMLILSPQLMDDERDTELARLENFLNKEEAYDITAEIKGRHRLAYNIDGHANGVFALFTYICKPATVPRVIKLLNAPASGQEGDILRHITIRYDK